jgi:hypothetical protein
MLQRHREDRSDEAIQSAFEVVHCFATLAITARGGW